MTIKSISAFIKPQFSGTSFLNKFPVTVTVPSCVILNLVAVFPPFFLN